MSKSDVVDLTTGLGIRLDRVKLEEVLTCVRASGVDGVEAKRRVRVFLEGACDVGLNHLLDKGGVYLDSEGN